MTHDKAIQRTDDDAAQSKLCAVERGYYSDIHISKFVSGGRPRLPLINIGTFCRIKAVDILTAQFLGDGTSPRQIVSLGAGSDTRPFHLLPQFPKTNYFELDFPVKAQQKADTILGDKELMEAVGSPQLTQRGLESKNYHLIGCDLRTEKLQLDLDPSIPTLILSECCLCYMSPEHSTEILSYFSSFQSVSIALYEPISLGDEFGRVMQVNLLQRGISLPAFQKFYSLETQKDRLAALGLEASACDILGVYRRWLSREERNRIAALEFLDEVEEMNLLLKHYCIVWGGRGTHWTGIHI